jgi:acetylornithine deacetylase/succinyl-diaminopimelate desuccinylase-like protein
MTNAQDYAEENGGLFLDQLFDLIRIPSISTLPEHAVDVKRAADWLVSDMKRIGLQNAEAIATAGHPIVYGEWMDAGASAPTLLVYGHYDVQPAEMVDGWTSDPFEPVVREDGYIYARGSIDDKGQVFAHLKAVESLLASENKLPVNIKFLIEGEEEISSAHLAEFVNNNVERLKSDVCVISDTGMDDIEKPEICYALRGLVYMELHIRGPAVDMHSGAGGTVHNPAQAISEIIAQLHHPDGSVNVPGFYDDVLLLDSQERETLNKHALGDDYWLELTGIPMAWGEPGYTLVERMGARPTLEINGLLSGFTGPGAKTVLPAKAMAKISCRLVANQKAQRIYELLRDHIANITPPTVHSELTLLHTGEAAYTDLKAPSIQAAIAAFKHGWGGDPIFTRSGGSIPIVADFQDKLGVPVVLLGFGVGDGAHGPDERFMVEAFHRGVKTAICFYEEIGKMRG